MFFSLPFPLVALRKCFIDSLAGFRALDVDARAFGRDHVPQADYASRVVASHLLGLRRIANPIATFSRTNVGFSAHDR
jgi:hypothetical protein